MKFMLHLLFSNGQAVLLITESDTMALSIRGDVLNSQGPRIDDPGAMAKLMNAKYCVFSASSRVPEDGKFDSVIHRLGCSYKDLMEPTKVMSIHISALSVDFCNGPDDVPSWIEGDDTDECHLYSMDSLIATLDTWAVDLRYHLNRIARMRELATEALAKEWGTVH